MLPVNEAETIIFNLVPPLNNPSNREIVDLLSARGRILAVPVTSELDFPHWDNSAMDGYAVRYEDVKNSSRENPAVLEVMGEIPAGYQPKLSLQPGQAARIFTGAVMPEGADTVVMQEVTQRQENHVLIQAAPKAQQFVRKRGAYYQAGNKLLPDGIMINAPEIAILAAAQCNQVSVFRKVKVVIFSTGDELVTPHQPLQPGQIVDSNNYALAALVEQLGAEVLMLGIVPDQPEALRKTIATAIENADIILSSGGVSVGDYDYVEEILAALGGEIHIRSIAMKPGKPLTVATFSLRDCRHPIYFGLPGNPAAALVTFWRFVQPTIRKLSGLTNGWQPVWIRAKVSQELRSDGKRESYIWGKLNLVDGIYEFFLAAGNQVSGNLINLAHTNALAVLPVGQKVVLAGEEVMVLQV
ncbi:molybdopterin biosynthesis protein MoeA [Calothrix sp. NIES-4101]|nr:molybdopterin biosynthesis protein MoeA [Calothrix sp. NIES-4101]